LPTAPKLFVIPSKLMNAFAVGRRDNSAVAITDALARRLTPRELAGVLAHEISHIAHEDEKVMAFGDIVAHLTSFMSTVGLLSLFLYHARFAGGHGAHQPRLLVGGLLASPSLGRLLQNAPSRTG